MDANYLSNRKNRSIATNCNLNLFRIFLYLVSVQKRPSEN